MKRNGPRGERIGRRGLAGEEDEDAIAKRRLSRSPVKEKGKKIGGGAIPSGCGLTEAGTQSELPSRNNHHMFWYNIKGWGHFHCKHSEITFSPPQKAVCSSSFVL